MCDICHTSPCNSRCPNAADPIPCYVCDGCSGTICEGESVWHIQQEVYCAECIESFRSEAEYAGDY